MTSHMKPGPLFIPMGNVRFATLCHLELEADLTRISDMKPERKLRIESVVGV